jgi:hypothetical protein
MDELGFDSISPIFSRPVGIRRRPTLIHSTMDQRKGKQKRQDPAIPGKKMKPIIEEDLARFIACVAPLPRRLDEGSHQRPSGAAEKHQTGKSLEEGESGLIGDVGLQSPPLPHLLPPEEDNEEDEDTVAPSSADGAQRPTPCRHGDILSTKPIATPTSTSIHVAPAS